MTKQKLQPSNENILTRGELIRWIEERVKEYRSEAVDSINRNDHMNTLKGKCKLTQDEIDAVLVDFVNFCGSWQGLDWGLHSHHLKDK